jgi:hypothetical protein
MIMKLKQITVPIENSHKRLYEFTRALGENGINPRGLTLVDTGDFGEARVLVSDTARARQILMQKGIPGRIDDVVAVELENKPGQLPDLLEKLMAADIKVRYSYALAGMNSGSTIMIFRFSDNDKAIEVLRKKEVPIVDRQTIGTLEAAY